MILRRLGCFLLLCGCGTSFAQQPSGGFYWADFHSLKDQSVVVWVTRSLSAEKWTAIREIGVEYDAALVVTTERANPQALPSADTFTVWSVSLTNHGITPLLKGVHLRWAGWMNFAPGKQLEPGVLYDDCMACEATTYFTAFRYDFQQHTWAARWVRGGRGVPVWSANLPAGVAFTQVYAVMAEPNGREVLGTWEHFDYGALKPSENYVYQYDVDSFSGLERTQLLSGKQAESMKQRLCSAQNAASDSGLARGQDSPLCRQTVKPRFERKPVTTPPANNQGRSVPPGGRR